MQRLVIIKLLFLGIEERYEVEHPVPRPNADLI